MSGLKKFLLVACIGLWVCSVGAVAEDAELAVEHEVGMRAACVEDLERAWKDLTVSDQIRPLLAVVQHHYPNTPYSMVQDPDGSELETELGNLEYPDECSSFMNSFWNATAKAPCFGSLDYDKSFRQLIGQNKRVDEVLGAAGACDASERTHEERNVEIKAACVKELESAWKDLTVSDQIRQLLAVVQLHYPNTPYSMVRDPDESELDTELDNLRYPGECSSFIKSFWEATDKAPCFASFDFDESFRQLVVQNKRVDEVLGAAEACRFSKMLLKRQNAAENSPSIDAEAANEI